jgi:hypothetical protein
MIGGMADVTQILSAIEAGDPHAAAELVRSSTTTCRRSRPQTLVLTCVGCIDAATEASKFIACCVE